MLKKPDSIKTTIVLVGNFNPRIFVPLWFSNNEVIGKEESEKADVEVVHKEFTKFKLDWLTLVAEPQRFITEVIQPPDIRLHDFVLKTFGELLPHTPIWAMGINRGVEFDAGSREARDRIGFKLAPPEAWGEWSEDLLRQESDGNHGGMMSLSMRQVTVDDRSGGYIQSQVEPVKGSVSSVRVHVNDHYEISKPADQVEGCSEIIGLMSDRYEKSIGRSDWIVDQIMELAK